MSESSEDLENLSNPLDFRIPPETNRLMVKSTQPERAEEKIHNIISSHINDKIGISHHQKAQIILILTKLN